VNLICTAPISKQPTTTIDITTPTPPTMSALAKQLLEKAQIEPPPLQPPQTSMDVTIGRLRQKYSGLIPSLSSSSSSSLPTSATRYGPSENQQQLRPEDLAGFERLSNVQICSTCQGKGTCRQQFHHYHVDVDCDHCGGEGTILKETAESSIQKAKDLKTNATALFKQQKYHQADALFKEGIDAIMSFRVGKDANGLRRALLLNRAACALKLQQWQAGLEHCTLVLKKAPNNVKALWRMSVALEGLQEIERAMVCLTQMLAQEATHTRGIAALERLRAEVAATKVEEEQKEDCSGSSSTKVESID
jgi:tetratricopeptide (TPR) repeat protein